MTWPKITYCVITYNEEENIFGCLQSIFSQDYPIDKLEVILVDDKSSDRTVEIAQQFPVKVLYNGKKDADLSLTIGFKAATGEYYSGIGADMRLVGKDWFKKMVKPMIENKDIAASVTRYYSHPDDSLITRYLNLDPIQRDLVYQFLTPGFDEVITEKKTGYFICEYSLNKIPPQIHGLYKVSIMKKILNQQKIWYDMGNLVLLVKSGHFKFAYVPKAGMYHFHAKNIEALLKKRIRNIQRSYLRYVSKKETMTGLYQYIDLNQPKDLFKAMLIVIGANLIIPILGLSIIKALKNKKWLYLLDAPVTFLLVDTILYTFLSDPRGRKLLVQKSLKLMKLDDA